MRRRDFFKILGIGGLVGVSALNAREKSSSNKRVVVIGGGFGGATCAKYLKMWGGNGVEVILVDKNRVYNSPILSNLVLNGQKSIYEFSYDSLANSYGVKFVNSEVTNIDFNAKRVFFGSNGNLSYDKLVLATGIDFNPPNSYDFNIVPHAWIAGEQTRVLKSKIDTLGNGDEFILTIPKAPYRCPPGPYERACVVADYLKNIKRVNAKVLVLDENSDILVEKESFSKAFLDLGVEYIAGVNIDRVDDKTMSIYYTKDANSLRRDAKVLNVIPRQRASQLVYGARLVDESGFAPVNLLNYESLIVKDVHIIGDSHKSSQPKAGHIANSQAKICADAILRELNGYALYTAPKTNSACYSPTSSSSATWLSAVYEYDGASNSMKMISFGSGASSQKNYSEMFNWAINLFGDTFS